MCKDIKINIERLEELIGILFFEGLYFDEDVDKYNNEKSEDVRKRLLERWKGLSEKNSEASHLVGDLTVVKNSLTMPLREECKSQLGTYLFIMNSMIARSKFVEEISE